VAAHLSIVNTIAYAPDGRLVASTDSDDTTKIWDAATHRLLKTIRLNPAVPPRIAYSDRSTDGQILDPGSSAGFSADGADLLVGYSSFLSRLEVASGRKRWLVVYSTFLSRLEVASGRKRWSMATNLRFPGCSMAGTNLAVARPIYPRTSMAFVNLQSGQVVFLFTNGRSDTICVAPDGHLVARWDRELHRVSFHRVPEGDIISSFDAGRMYVIDMAFTPDGRTLALGNYATGDVELFDVATQTRLGELAGGTGRMEALAISPDGRWLVTGGDDQTIHLWDLAHRKEVRQLRGHRTRVDALAFAPDSRHLVSGGWDGTVRFWSVQPAAEPAPMTNVFGTFAFSPDGGRLVTQDANGVARLWALPARQQLAEWPTSAFQSAVFAGHETLWLAGPGSSNEPPDLRRVSFSQTSPAVQTIPLAGILSPCTAISLSPDGARAVTGHANGTLAVWDAIDGRLEQRMDHVFQGRSQFLSVNSLEFSAEGNCVAAATFQGVWLKTWTFPGLQPVGDRQFNNITPVAVAVSPDGRRVASGADEGLSVGIWPAGLVTREMELRGHLDRTVAAAFSPDGRTLATGAADGLLKLWNLATGRDVVTLPLGRDAEARYIAFSADGTWLGVADSQGVLHLFDAPAPAARPSGQ
jgi:WD40 repeat protein